jgi:hypothetical protein
LIDKSLSFLQQEELKMRSAFDSVKRATELYQPSYMLDILKRENEMRRIGMPDSLINPFEKYHLDAMKTVEEGMKKQFEYNQHIKSIIPNYITDSLRIFNDTQEKFRALTSKSYQSEIFKSFDHINAIEKYALNPIANTFQNYLADYLKPVLNIEDDLFDRNKIFGLNNSMLEAVDFMKKSQSIHLPDYVADAMKILEQMNAIYSIDESGNFLIDEDVDVEGILEKAGEFLEQIANAIIDPKSWALEQSKPVKFLIAVVLLSSFLAAASMNYMKFYDFFMQGDSNLNQREKIKAIIKEEKFYVDDLRGYKFVTTKILNVRRFGNIKSEIIDDIFFGKKVKILEKSKDWSFIEYEDYETLEIKQGWVFSRYLHKFEN